MEPDYVRAIRPFLEGKAVLLVMEHPVGAGPFAEKLRALGATQIFMIAAQTGIGEIPDQADVPHRILGVTANSTMAGFRAADAAFENLPADVTGWVDQLDPDHQAVVLAAPFGGRPEVAGRAVFGDRPPEWIAIEDKMTVDTIWQATSTPHAPFRLIDLDHLAVSHAFSDLDRGDGIVLAGDNKEGWHGGGEYVRWVRTAGDIDSVLADFGERSDRARAMPFLEGIPCSVHGLVVPHRTLTFRPVEMIILRKPDSATFQYAGMATGWDPSEGDRAAMRSAANRVGEYLRDAFDYRGAFSIDGVMTVDGFLPTELNPRLSGGFSMHAGAIDDLPLGMINRALVNGHTLDIDWDALETAMVESADAQRRGRCFMPLDHHVEAPATMRVRWNADGWVEDDEAGTAKISVGHGVTGSLLLFAPDPGAIPVGPSLAPLVAQAVAFANDHMGVNTGQLQPAPEVRK